MRQRSGDEEQEQAAGVARVGFAFSQDPSACAHEIKMIMRNRYEGYRAGSKERGVRDYESTFPTCLAYQSVSLALKYA